MEGMEGGKVVGRVEEGRREGRGEKVEERS